jgi:hypothetical protein
MPLPKPAIPGCKGLSSRKENMYMALRLSKTVQLAEYKMKLR